MEFIVGKRLTFTYLDPWSSFSWIFVTKNVTKHFYCNHLISNHQHIAKLMQNICTDPSISIIAPSILFPSKSLGFLKHIFLEHKSSNAASPALNFRIKAYQKWREKIPTLTLAWIWLRIRPLSSSLSMSQFFCLSVPTAHQAPSTVRISTVVGLSIQRLCAPRFREVLFHFFNWNVSLHFRKGFPRYHNLILLYRLPLQCTLSTHTFCSSLVLNGYQKLHHEFIHLLFIVELENINSIRARSYTFLSSQ